MKQNATYLCLIVAAAMIPVPAYAGQITTHVSTPHFSVPHVPTPQIGSHSSGAGAGRVSIHEIHVTKQNDKSSPSLFKRAVTGKHFNNGVMI